MKGIVFVGIFLTLIYYSLSQMRQYRDLAIARVSLSNPKYGTIPKSSIVDHDIRIYRQWIPEVTFYYIGVVSIGYFQTFTFNSNSYYKMELLNQGVRNNSILKLRVTLTKDMPIYPLWIHVIGVGKDIPLYFRSFQYDIKNPETKTQNQKIKIINYSSILNETLPLSKGLKAIYSIIGLFYNDFMPDMPDVLSIPSNLIYLDSMGLKYNISGLDSRFITGLTVCIAVFETSTVLNQKVYVFDFLSYTVQTRTPTPKMTLPKNIGLNFIGGMYENIQWDKGVAYSYDFWYDYPSNPLSQVYQSTLYEDIQTYAYKGTKIITSFFLVGTYECESLRKSCQNVCESTQSTALNVNWSLDCSVCVAAGKCSTKACGNGNIEPNEECDLGFYNGQQGSGCALDCTIVAGYYCSDVNGIGSMCSPRCGDGIVAIGTQVCDSGTHNGQLDNFCSNNCNPVPGFYCKTVDSVSECFSQCGDGLMAADEQCDLGSNNGLPGFGCSRSCAVVSGFYCVVNQNLSSLCRTVCGDGIVAGTETCDTKYFNGLKASGCNKECQIIDGFKCTLDSHLTSHCVSVCGDGIVAGNEGCDTGKFGDGCSANCTVLPGFYCKNNVSSVCSPVCGDGIVAGNEKCDLGQDFNKARYGCLGTCTVFPGFYCEITSNFTSVCTTKCGDSIVVGTQVCDNGLNNGVILNGCSNDCQALPGFYCSITSALTSFCVTYCGDGYASGKEQCDDGNNTGTKGYGCGLDCVPIKGFNCSISNFISFCNTKCGDGVVMGKEACDTGNFSNPQTYGCASDCTIMPGFYCSVGPTFGSVCTSKCGDGVAVAAFEACDNGPLNGSPGNGCTLDCTVTIGFVCKIRQLLSFCETFCGDGIVAGSEECDEGSSNGQPLSACSKQCSVNQGFYCKFVDASLHCFPFCGDGLVVGYEQCDSGPSNGKFGQPCNSNCSAFAGYYNCSSANNATVCATLCGDSVVAGKEECDLGLQNGIANSFCSSVCTLNSGVCIPIDPNFSCISFSLNNQNLVKGPHIDSY